MIGRFFTAIDLWVGKTLFIPVIIRLCQLFRCDQNRFGWTFYFMASLDGLYYGQGWFMKALFGFGAFVSCIVANFAPERTSTSMGWRMLLFSFIVFFGLASVLERDVPWILGYDLLILVAEYAWTIRTIPPLETKEKKPSLKTAKAKA